MGFVFRLEKVAKYRQQLVDRQARRLATAEREVAAAQARLAGVEADLVATRHDPELNSSTTIDVPALTTRTRWIAHLEIRRDEAAEHLAVLQAAAATERGILRKAWQDLEVLHALRTKQRADWRAEQARRERLVLDEIGQIRADRQKRSKVAP